MPGGMPDPLLHFRPVGCPLVPLCAVRHPYHSRGHLCASALLLVTRQVAMAPANEHVDYVLFDNGKRSIHHLLQVFTYHLCVALQLGLANSAPLIFYGNNWRDVVCANDVSAADMTDSSLCAFQGRYLIECFQSECC